MSSLRVSREQVLAYRVRAHQLDRSVPHARDLAVVDLGVQDTPYGVAQLALAARTPGVPDLMGLTLVWSVRGAPHWHRTESLVDTAAALWPLSDEDATRRISVTRIKEGARTGLAAYRVTAQAFTEVVRAPMPRGEVSTQVTRRVPASLTYWCPPCEATHVAGTVFDSAALAGGMRLERDGQKTLLAPIDDWPGIPAQARGTGDLIRGYLRLLGPATEKEVAAFLGTAPKALRPAWPADLVEVGVDGRVTFLPADAEEQLRSAPASDLVRLLPASDPWLQARDRELLVADRSRRQAVWTALGRPGSVLVGGEIVGTWRARSKGRGLELTVTPFETLSPRVVRTIEAEADVVAATRGATSVTVALG